MRDVLNVFILNYCILNILIVIYSVFRSQQTGIRAGFMVGFWLTIEIKWIGDSYQLNNFMGDIFCFKGLTRNIDDEG